MKFDSNIPIYIQIIQEIKRLIVIETYKPSEKIPSVRELAVALGVNPNTVQRALSELEREGLLNSERTSGRFISEDKDVIDQLKLDVVYQKIDQFIQEIKLYGCSDEFITNTVKERVKHGKFN